MFRFAHSNLLILLSICVFFIVLLILHNRTRRNRLSKYGEWALVKNLIPHFAKNLPTYKILFLIMALAFIILALARPQFGEKTEVVRKEGVEIMIALDISNSMLAEDITPNRLERAKYALTRLVDRLKNDKIGLVVFAGDAFVQLPMTHDYSSAKLFVSTISTELISRQGTSIGSAIDLASKSFSTDSDIGKAIIIITDGEDHSGTAIKSAKMAYEKGIQIFTIGIGLDKGVPIPIAGSPGQFMKDENGETVISKLNPDFLKKVSEASNGTYIQASNTNVGLDDILNEINKMNTENFESKTFVAHAEQFQYFIGGAILFLIIGMIFPERKYQFLEQLNIFKIKEKE